MALANCPRCGKAFNKIPGIAMCEGCRAKVEEDFDKCWHFLRDLPNSTVKQIAEGTGVAEPQILEFYRTGRLLTGDKGLPCEKCGKPAVRGRFCAACAGSLAQGLREGATDLGSRPQQGFDPGEGGGRRDFSHKLRVDR